MIVLLIPCRLMDFVDRLQFTSVWQENGPRVHHQHQRVDLNSGLIQFRVTKSGVSSHLPGVVWSLFFLARSRLPDPWRLISSRKVFRQTSSSCVDNFLVVILTCTVSSLSSYPKSRSENIEMSLHPNLNCNWPSWTSLMSLFIGASQFWRLELSPTSEMNWLILMLLYCMYVLQEQRGCSSHWT